MEVLNTTMQNKWRSWGKYWILALAPLKPAFVTNLTHLARCSLVTDCHIWFTRLSLFHQESIRNCTSHIYLRQVNIVNTGGDYEIGRSVRRSLCLFVYTMSNNSNDVIAPTGQAATPAITLTSHHWSKVALPSASVFLVFTSLGGDMHSHKRLPVYTC